MPDIRPVQISEDCRCGGSLTIHTSASQKMIKTLGVEWFAHEGDLVTCDQCDETFEVHVDDARSAFIGRGSR